MLEPAGMLMACLFKKLAIPSLQDIPLISSVGTACAPLPLITVNEWRNEWTDGERACILQTKLVQRIIVFPASVQLFQRKSRWIAERTAYHARLLSHAGANERETIPHLSLSFVHLRRTYRCVLLYCCCCTRCFIVASYVTTDSIVLPYGAHLHPKFTRLLRARLDISPNLSKLPSRGLKLSRGHREVEVSASALTVACAPFASTLWPSRRAPRAGCDCKHT